MKALLLLALMGLALPAHADTIRDRSGRVTATVKQTGPESFTVRDRTGRATARVTCSGSSCISRDPRTGKALGTITKR